jgi:hypothetical protein
LPAAFSVLACTPARPLPREPIREVCAPIPPCTSWVDALRQNPTTLHVYVVDRVSGFGCAAGESIAVDVVLDDAPVGTTTFPCANELRAPARRYLITGGEVVPGMHELSVRLRLAAGSREAGALMSLPAFDFGPDGRTAMIGAEIMVEVTRDDVTIAPPVVLVPPGL